MRLGSGASISPHRDDGLSIEYDLARLHMPITTNQDVVFKVNQQVIPMSQNELWYINADQTHSVDNQGTTDRINLVIDCIANDWLKQSIMSSNEQIS